MMTTPVPVTSFIPHLTIQFNWSNSTSNSTSHSTSNSTSPPLSDLLMSCFTMIFGTISNLTALGILAMSRSRFRGQSNLPFLLLTVALLLADLGGHFILGAFALYGHISARYKIPSLKSSVAFCKIFGASMVFFGLCPLLLGCAMAVERWVAISRPFLHVYITVAHVKRVVLIFISSALVLALLPIFYVGKYTTQFPDTWCFLPIQDSPSTADKNLVLAFSCLGLTALILSLLCNILSGLPLLKAKLKSRNCYTKPSAQGSSRASSTSTSTIFCSLEVEMLVQLAGVTVVSCVCWGPFLINIFMKQFNWDPKGQEDRFTLQSLRMVTWNQILDPWVYILIRRTMLSKLCCGLHNQSFMTPNPSFTDSRRETFM